MNDAVLELTEVQIRPEVDRPEGECTRKPRPKHPYWLLFLLLAKLCLNDPMTTLSRDLQDTDMNEDTAAAGKGGRKEVPEDRKRVRRGKPSVASSQQDMTDSGAAEAGKRENPLAWVRINLAYFRTPPGCLKILQLLLGIICMACASPAILTGTHWFLFVTVISFMATLIWVFVYLLSIREALTLPINWILTEVVNTGIITVLYFTAFIVQLLIWLPEYSTYYRAPNISAGVTLFLYTLLFNIYIKRFLHQKYEINNIAKLNNKFQASKSRYYVGKNTIEPML